MTPKSFDVIILAGGRGSRLGGVDKAAIELDGSRLVDRTVLAALAAGAVRTIVVGPPHAAVRASHVIREDPPFTGPLSATLAGLRLVEAPRVMLLACDLVNPDLVCRILAKETLATHSGAVLRDSDGYPQWLASMHETETLRRAAAHLDGAVDDQPLRRLFSPNTMRFVDAPADITRDIDSPEDLAWARARRGTTQAPAEDP